MPFYFVLKEDFYLKYIWARPNPDFHSPDRNQGGFFPASYTCRWGCLYLRPF